MALLLVLVAGSLALQVASLERELEAAREALAAARETQAIQDASLRDADLFIAQMGPPCAALADLHPALSRRAALRGQR